MSEAQVSPREIRVTSRLLDEIADLLTNHPDSRKVLLDFFRFRETSPPRSSFNTKDYMLGGILGGIWHVHVIHGQALLIYELSRERVDAYCIVDHTHVESTGKQRALRKFIKNCAKDAFINYDFEDHLGEQPTHEPRRALPDADRSEVERFFYELVLHPDDRPAVEKAASGDFGELLDLVACIVNWNGSFEGLRPLLFEAFGGEEALKDRLSSILRDYTCPAE